MSTGAKMETAAFPTSAQVAEWHLERVSDALRWVLPMAKGYAAAHDVGNNKELVTDAEQRLRLADENAPPAPSPASVDVPKVDTTELRKLLTHYRAMNQPGAADCIATLCDVIDAERESIRSLSTALETAEATLLELSHSHAKECDARYRAEALAREAGKALAAIVNHDVLGQDTWYANHPLFIAGRAVVAKLPPSRKEKE